MNRYQEITHYLFTALPVFQHIGGAAYKPGLQTAHELDDFYDNPHGKYKTIHVAGTNGKGSVSHMLAAVLQGAGFKTGLFTSPHLVDFRERIRINGRMISEQKVVEFVDRSKEMFDKVQPSFFEMTTAMAFDHFALNRVDYAVIETGMGGRLDSTNIISPIVSVITNISYDHTQFLGNTLPEIASEKAGIIKPGIPVIIGETHRDTAGIFECKANEAGSPVIFADAHVKVKKAEHRTAGQYIELEHERELIPVEIDLQGDYQQKNLVTVWNVLPFLFPQVTPGLRENIIRSLAHAAQTTGLQGRWQILRTAPLTICDTAHNTAGMSGITSQLAGCNYRRLRIVIGFVNDKDVSGLLQLLPSAAAYYFTRASVPRALNEMELEEKARQYGLYGRSFPTVDEALNAAWADAAEDDLVFVGGSTFIVADALKQ